jgi:hypothetical protein
VLGANEAGTALYVTSERVLTEAANPSGEKAGTGEGNVFLLKEAPAGAGWSASFVATLSSTDEKGYAFGFGSGTHQHLEDAAVRVSPNGEYFAFMTDRSLKIMSGHGVTSYDNRDAASGVPDEEVYLYHASPEGASAGKLVCASCNPTGARPVGQQDTGKYPGLAMDANHGWVPAEGENTGWLAATIPGWNENYHTVEKPYGGITSYYAPLYDPRELSNSGRLFFTTSDGLVPQDVNGRDDVYEYEPAGLGSCPAGEAGCVALISSGTGSGDSIFVDASATGDDVFFTTEQSLVPADNDPATDMYDAHVCSAEVPCLPVSSAVSPPCDATDSCRAAQALQPGVFNPSGSATFNGAGNLHAVSVVVPKLTAAQLRAKALAPALKTCRKKHGHRRKVCEASARRRYGPQRKAKKSAAHRVAAADIDSGRGSK